MIPVCEPTLIGNELKYVTDCIKTNWISSGGKYIKAFEEGFSKFCDTKYGIACSNGTTAIHLALAALGIKPDHEVIVPTFTMIACANAVVYCNAKPVFVDCDKRTWNIDVNKIEKKITKKTKAIMPVHIYGHPCDMDAINKIAKKHKLFVVEDAAEAHGAQYKARKTGSLGDIGCFSFYGNKILTTGEGGMCITNNKEFADKMRLLRNHAFIKPRFLHKELGYNYRMTNIQAAIGLAQLENIHKLVEARRRNAKLYNSLLKDIPGITLPVEESYAKNVYWMYGIMIEKEFGISRDEVMEGLEKKEVETRTFFIPMHQQPLYKEMGFVNTKEKFPVADEISKKGLYLPSSSSLTKDQIRFVVKALTSLRKV